MRQTLHVFLLDPGRCAVAAATVGRRWLVPVMTVAECTRPGVAVCSWLGRLGIAGHVAGQWLGRVAPTGDTIDWMVVVTASLGERQLPSTLRALPVDALLATNSIVDYQQWALARTVSQSGAWHVGGPFGSPRWVDEVLSWVRRALDRRASPILHVVPHRVSAFGVTIEIRTATARVFFKGLSRETAGEADLAAALGAVAPASFPRTLAIERRDDGSVWWLLAECEGSDLSHAATPASIRAAVTAYGRIQQRVTHHEGDWQRVAPRVDLQATQAWAISLLESGDCDNTCLRTALDNVCDSVQSSGVPWSWVAADLDPGNVIVNGERASFVDVGDALHGPAPLGTAILARRVSRMLTAASVAADLVDWYERASTPRIRIAGRWRDFQVMARIIECQLGWNRLVARTARGEVEGLLDIARTRLAQRIEQELTGYLATDGRRG